MWLLSRSTHSHTHNTHTHNTTLDKPYSFKLKPLLEIHRASTEKGFKIKICFSFFFSSFPKSNQRIGVCLFFRFIFGRYWHQLCHQHRTHSTTFIRVSFLCASRTNSCVSGSFSSYILMHSLNKSTKKKTFSGSTGT